MACQFGMMFFPDRSPPSPRPRGCWPRAARCSWSAWDRVEANLFADRLATALDRVYPDDPPTFVVRVPHGYHDVDVVRADAEAAGLVDVVVETVGLSSTTPSARDFATGVCTGSPLRAGWSSAATWRRPRSGSATRWPGCWARARSPHR